MIFGPAELVSFISQTITLSPGDIISTGTPPGVGSARKPPRYLHPGDSVTVSIERIGELTNPVEDEEV
jgi:2-keto-4-pentenoate hydratase/2-oxohepta-3-ene-1,7-dioic acid hydratase in catechol pathway